MGKRSGIRGVHSSVIPAAAGEVVKAPPRSLKEKIAEFFDDIRAIFTGERVGGIREPNAGIAQDK